MDRRRLVARVVIAVGLLAGSVLVRVAAPTLSSAAPIGAAAFVPLTPSRILDTRTGLGGVRLSDDSSIDVQVAGVGGVPTVGAAAVALNLTATDGTQSGFVTVWPAGASRPVVSNLNVERAGQTIPNFTVVRLGDGGKISLYALRALDLVADVAGYWVEVSSATGGRYVAAGPARILDTRNGTGAPKARVPDDGTLTLGVTGHGSVPTAGVSAVILNVTATDATGPGFVTVWPAGQGRPMASNLNVEHVGQTIPNLVIVPVGAGGAVSIYALKSLNLVADVLGYFTDDSAPNSDQGLFVPTQSRILDSRTLPQQGGFYASNIVGTYRADLQVAGQGGVPSSGVAAVIANITATNPAAPGFVTIYPAATAQPLASNLNVDDAGQTIPNLVVSRLGYLGRVSMFSLTDIDLVVDVAGWFTGDLTPPDPNVPVDPPLPPPNPSEPPLVQWTPYLHVPGVVDLAGPRADGSFVVTASGVLSILNADGTLLPFARGPGGYATLGGEPYIALSQDVPVDGAGCSFSQDTLFALEPTAQPGVISVDPQGVASRAADLPVGPLADGITFDQVGRFGHRLLVMVLGTAGATVYTLDCNGALATVAAAAPVAEGGMVVAPSTFGQFGGDLIVPDELSGRVIAIGPDGRATTIVNSGLPSGPDTGVESAGFVPPGFERSAAYLADRFTSGNAHPGTDSILRLTGSDLVNAGVRAGDLLLATEGGAHTIAVRCEQSCTVRHIADGPAVAHAEGHIVFSLPS
jgi:hypothetical protein